MGPCHSPIRSNHHRGRASVHAVGFATCTGVDEAIPRIREQRIAEPEFSLEHPQVFRSVMADGHQGHPLGPGLAFLTQLRELMAAVPSGEDPEEDEHLGARQGQRHLLALRRRQDDPRKGLAHPGPSSPSIGSTHIRAMRRGSETPHAPEDEQPGHDECGQGQPSGDGGSTPESRHFHRHKDSKSGPGFGVRCRVRHGGVRLTSGCRASALEGRLSPGIAAATPFPRRDSGSWLPRKRHAPQCGA